MSFGIVQDFTARAARYTSMSELGEALEGLTSSLGFDYYALVHEVAQTAGPEEAICLINYPTGWIETIIERQFYLDDPVFRATQKTSASFGWNELGRLIDLSAGQKTILETASREGMGDGFTVPAHLPGARSGSTSFAMRRGREMPRDTLPLAHMAGSVAFEAVRRIGQHRGEETRTGRLTSRQLDCVVLIGRGKTDWEIGRILGIAKATVRDHVEAAKVRYGVTGRAQLVVTALFEGEISFSDVIGRG